MEIAKCKRRPLVHGVAACVINSGVEDVSARSLCLPGERDKGITCLDSWDHYSESGNTLWAKQALSRAFKEVDGKGTESEMCWFRLQNMNSIIEDQNTSLPIFVWKVIFFPVFN